MPKIYKKTGGIILEMAAVISLTLAQNKSAMSEIIEITKALVDFRDERDWKQFHDTKKLAVALSIEVTELIKTYGNTRLAKKP